MPTSEVLCYAPQDATLDSLHATLTKALEDRPNAVCLYVTPRLASDPERMRSTIDLVSRGQSLLITMGQAVVDPRVHGQVGVSLPTAAALLAENAQRVAAGRHSYVLIHAEGRDAEATDCYRRFMATVRAKPVEDWHLLQETNAATADAPSTEIVEHVLDSFPHAGLVVTLDPDAWLAASPEWLAQLRGKHPQLRFATLSATPALWRWVGTPAAPGDAAALVGPLDGEVGYLAVELATRGLLGDRDAAPMRWVECELVTAATLPDFARRYAASANGLDVSAYLGGALTLPTRPARR